VHHSRAHFILGALHGAGAVSALRTLGAPVNTVQTLFAGSHIRGKICMAPSPRVSPSRSTHIFAESPLTTTEQQNPYANRNALVETDVMMLRGTNSTLPRSCRLFFCSMRHHVGSSIATCNDKVSDALWAIASLCKYQCWCSNITQAVTLCSRHLRACKRSGPASVHSQCDLNPCRRHSNSL
jgi:hypothetical protein